MCEGCYAWCWRMPASHGSSGRWTVTFFCDQGRRSVKRLSTIHHGAAMPAVVVRAGSVVGLKLLRVAQDE